MSISLFQSHASQLGNRFERLGNASGLYLTCTEEGVLSIAPLSFIQRLIRRWLSCFGFYSSTRLKHVVEKIVHSSAAMPEELRAKIEASWMRAYPRIACPLAALPQRELPSSPRMEGPQVPGSFDTLPKAQPPASPCPEWQLGPTRFRIGVEGEIDLRGYWKVEYVEGQMGVSFEESQDPAVPHRVKVPKPKGGNKKGKRHSLDFTKDGTAVNLFEGVLVAALNKGITRLALSPIDSRIIYRQLETLRALPQRSKEWEKSFVDIVLVGNKKFVEFVTNTAQTTLGNPK